MSVFIRCLWTALLTAAAVCGQSDLATVTGVVTDSAQGVMPGVTITIRNVETNIARSMESNEDGYFTFTNLAPGRYELTAEKAGFRGFRESEIVLQVGQILRSDVQLQVGAVSQSVNVTAEIAPLNTENGAIKGDVIVQQEIQDVPLNGRDFTDIAFLVPGVLPNAQGGAGSFASINGARGDNTNFYVDGFNDRNSRGAAAQFRPPIDALQEFKMEVGGFSAEYGRMAGGILNMVLKSGTNQFHGTLFEYLRNDRLDARAYFDTSQLPLRQNQFGGVIGGPVILPKYNGRNRTFFLLSEESYRQVFGQTRLGNVPTSLERSGDFTKSLDVAGKQILVKDPYAANALFPGNVIPASVFSPVALNLIKYYPLPNRSSLQNNYFATANNLSDWDSFVTKIDHRSSSADSLSFRYGKRFGRHNAPWAGSNLGTFQNWVQDDRSFGGLDHTHLFSPTLIMETRVGFSRNSTREHIIKAGFPTASQLGMQGSTADPQLEGFPLVNVTNFLAVGYANNEPVQYFLTDIQLGNKFTWIKGKHVLKWGVDHSRVRFNQPYFNNSRGTMTANGNWTGDAIGDLMLGLLNSSTITQQVTRNYLRFSVYGAMVNDDYKVTRSLTLNLGLRYEIDEPPRDRYDRLLNFVPELAKVIISSDATIPNLPQMTVDAKLTGRVALAKDYGLPRSLVFTNYKNLAPRFGFAWRPFGSQKAVLRAGYGIFYSGQLLNDVRLGLGTSWPFSTNLSFARNTSNPNALTLSNPWPLAIATLAGTNTSTGFQLHAPTGYLQTYNLTVEREWSAAAVVELAYVGSKGTHLGRQYNVNMPFRTIANYQAFGTAFPVPYPPLSTINYWSFGSNSIYNAGQVTLRKRSTGGLFYRLSYTYGKSIDDASQFTGASTGGFAQALDSRNLSLERARSDWDRGHAFTAVFSWPLPVGRGRRLLSGRGRLANGILGGWQLSGTSQLLSGQPFTVQDSSVNQSIGESVRPNRIASGKSVSGAGRRGVDYPWFAPFAFVDVPGCASRTNCSPDQYGFLPFAAGNSGRNILDGPGLAYINTTLMKNWFLVERRKIQLRYEVFNITNHPNFQLPNRNFNETAAGIISSVQDSGRGGPRVMQFALKFEF